MITKTDIVTLEFHTIATPKVLPLYAQFKSGESTKRFVAVGDAVARALLGVLTTDFDLQTSAARAENANLLGWVEGTGRTAVHLVGSTISPGNNILARNMFVPKYYLDEVEKVNRILIAYFLRCSPMGTDELSVEVAGWTTAEKVKTMIADQTKPASFESSLKVEAFPALQLSPVATIPKLDFDFVF